VSCSKVTAIQLDLHSIFPFQFFFTSDLNARLDGTRRFENVIATST